MFVLISYDIENDKVRTRLHKKLKDFGPRVQYSVFEADVNKDELEKLKNLLSKTEIGDDDSLRLYKLCESCRNNVQIWGQGEVTEDKDVYIV